MQTDFKEDNQPNLSEKLAYSRLVSLINSMADGVIAVENKYDVIFRFVALRL